MAFGSTAPRGGRGGASPRPTEENAAGRFVLPVAGVTFSLGLEVATPAGQKAAMKPNRRRSRAFAAILALLVGGCATAERIDAAGDVHALLIAIRDDDRTKFDAHVDRPALEKELEGRIIERTQAAGSGDSLRTLGAVLAQPLARLAGETLIQPEVFRSVAEFYGYRPDTPVPNQLVIAQALRALPDGRVCAAKKHGGPCLLTFADESGVWRLVSFDGDVGMLRLR